MQNEEYEAFKRERIKEVIPEPVPLVGIDFGQAKDYTALVVVEKYYVPTSNLYYDDTWHSSKGSSWVDVQSHYAVKHIERFELGMSYSKQVERVMKLVEHLSGLVVIACDATGVGRAVVNILHEAIWELGKDENCPPQIHTLQPAYVNITGGSAVTRSPMGLLNVPKRELVTTPLVLFQDERLSISQDLEYQALLQKELLNFKVKINIATGHDTYEAWREGMHDDLVLALSLACWVGDRYIEEERRVEVKGLVVLDAPMFEASGGVV